MELDLQFVVMQKNGGDTVKIFDNTGVNNGIANPHGWSDGTHGTDNPHQDEITKITITITKGALTFTIELTGSDITNYLNPTVGYENTSASIFGSDYIFFEDGIYTFVVKYKGATINDVVTAWDQTHTVYDAFLWTIWGEMRTMVIDMMTVPVKNMVEAANVAVANILMDDIFFLCQYGDADGAQEVLDFLTDDIENNSNLNELFRNLQSYD